MRQLLFSELVLWSALHEGLECGEKEVENCCHLVWVKIWKVDSVLYCSQCFGYEKS
jgi:hypothetical protein